MSLIPAEYLPPIGGPLYWKNETSGILAEAVTAYIYWAAGATLGQSKPEPSAPQLRLVIEYVKYWVNAPCWAGPDLDELRARELLTLADVNRFIEDCQNAGLDPL